MWGPGNPLTHDRPGKNALEDQVIASFLELVGDFIRFAVQLFAHVLQIGLNVLFKRVAS